MRIVSDFTGEPKWRGGVTHCPNCDWGIGLKWEDTKKWDDPKNVREIVIRSDALMQKADSILISSECPQCFEVSFLHHSFDAVETSASLFNWPKNITKLILEEKERRIFRGEFFWEKSWCKKCAIKHSVDWTYLSPYVTCSKGHHKPSWSILEECKDFKKKRIRK